jgi:hypothetical protein
MGVGWLGRVNHFWRLSWILWMDGWFEGEAGVDLAVRVAVLRCMCWRSYL